MELEVVKQVLEWQKDPNSEFYVKPDEFEREPVKGFEHPVKKKDGVFLQEDLVSVSLLKEFQLRSDDIFIIGFPKSG